jgi:hypothetical protein
MVVTFQDAAVAVLAIAGAAILVRRLTGAMRPKKPAQCDHCAISETKNVR